MQQYKIITGCMLPEIDTISLDILAKWNPQGEKGTRQTNQYMEGWD
jgi:hypothetical protein